MRGFNSGTRPLLPGRHCCRRFEKKLPQTAAGPADTGEHGAQRNTLQIGSLLMGEAAHDNQQQRFAEFLGEPAERPLHRGGEFVRERVPAERCCRLGKLTHAGRTTALDRRQ